MYRRPGTSSLHPGHVLGIHIEIRPHELAALLLDGVDLSRCVLASSGRLAGEMVLKAAAAGIPVVCSLSAPLVSGIRVAEAAGIRLVGFVRGRRMNVYS